MNGYMLLITMIFAGCTAICMIVNHRTKKTIALTYQIILQKLDRTIGGEIQPASYDESMDAAITERLNRIVQITRMGKKNAEKERDNIKSLISDISHQVRTPLTNIILYTGLLQEQDIDSGTMALADKIRKQSEKLDFFMKELVKSSYTEQEMISIHPQRMQVEELLHTSCQIVELAALKKNMHIIQAETDALCYADKNGQRRPS